MLFDRNFPHLPDLFFTSALRCQHADAILELVGEILLHRRFERDGHPRAAIVSVSLFHAVIAKAAEIAVYILPAVLREIVQLSVCNRT